MKLLIKIIVLAAVFAGGVWVGQNVALAPSQLVDQLPINVNKKSEVQEQVIKVNLMIDFGNGQVQTFNDVALAENPSVFDLLKKVTTENNLEFSSKDYGKDLGMLVESINNVANSQKANRFWHYWVNNVYAEIGASNYHLKTGDIVEWKYVENQFNLIKH